VVIAPDDIVDRWHRVAPGARPPLVVLEPLRRFLDGLGLGDGELSLEPVGDGHSNVTYLVARDGLDMVLRRPPRPPLPPSAHDVLREARLMRALAGSAVPVPRILATCDDPAVIGAPFVIMEKVYGPVVTSAMPPTLDDGVARRRAGEQLIDVLAALGEVDWRAAGLDGFGRPDGYLERQLARFGGLWERNRTRPLPVVEDVGRWLAEHRPRSGPATIVHGDFRLGNVILAPDPPLHIVAVLDWELSTIGDPLADLGYLLALWVEPGDASLGDFEQGGLTRLPGFSTRTELAERYERRTGRAAADIAFYEVLALWKLAVLMEGNVRRAQEGTTDDPYLASFGAGVVLLAERAAERAGGTWG
jgi:aminoglycoside phosphotransferase (APT) family kinase protein